MMFNWKLSACLPVGREKFFWPDGLNSEIAGRKKFFRGYFNNFMPHDRILPVPLPEQQNLPQKKSADAGYDEIYSSGYSAGYDTDDVDDEGEGNDGPPPPAPKGTIH